jgi:Flp pilus assembly protein TadD
MAHVFLSYSASDRDRVEPLVRALQAHGLPIWWDHRIPPGRTWHDVVEEALSLAECVVVVWTRDSVRSDWVCAEAEEGRRRKILVPVLFDDVKIPLEFRRIQAAKLIKWTDGAAHPEFEKLKAAIDRLMKRASPSSDTSTRDVTPDKAPDPDSIAQAASRKRRMWLALSLAAAFLWAGAWWGLRSLRETDQTAGRNATSAPAPTPVPTPESAAAGQPSPPATEENDHGPSPPPAPETAGATVPLDNPSTSGEATETARAAGSPVPHPETNAEALQLVKQIISLSQANGGLDHEPEIAGARRRINELRDATSTSQPRGDRTRARQLNGEAQAQLRAGRLPEALRLFEQAHDADPTDIEVRNNLAYVLMKTGALARAEQELLGVLALRPDRVPAWANIGCTYALMNRPREAVASLANAYRFSTSPVRNRSFLRQLQDEDEDARVRAAAKQTLSLGLIAQSIPPVRAGATEAAADQAAPDAPVEIPVVHRHGMGSCNGSLALGGDMLRYQTSRSDDGFEISLPGVEQFDTDAVRKTLRVKLRGGRTYNFTAPASSAAGFVHFQQAVSAGLARRDAKGRQR